jgi:uncharacterized protein YndB with AHSA1/START domain
MDDLSQTPIAEDSRTLVIARMLDAPRTLVFRAFSDPFHLSQWWGPAGYTNPVCEIDFRVGGKWHHTMRGPDGRDLPVINEYLEITPPERIVYRNFIEDAAAFGDNPPPSFVRTITFAEQGGKTLLTMVARFDTTVEKENAVTRGFRQGTEQSFDKLEAHLRTL